MTGGPIANCPRPALSPSPGPPHEPMDESDPKVFDWSDHAGKVVVASPCLSAMVSWVVITIADVQRGPAPAPFPPTALVLLFINAALATFGSAVGGALIRDTLGQRIAVSLAAGAFGFAIFCGLVVCPGVFHPPTD